MHVNLHRMIRTLTRLVQKASDSPYLSEGVGVERGVVDVEVCVCGSKNVYASFGCAGLSRPLLRRILL